MQFTPEALDKLRTIYYAEFGKQITRAEAAEMGQRLVDLVRLLLRPLPKTHPDTDTPAD